MPLAPVDTTASKLAQRSTPQEVRNQHDLVRSQPQLADLIEAMPGMVALLDLNRQIILANSSFQNQLGPEAVEQILGKRPGEATGCKHAGTCEGGCGTSPSCGSCGALMAILAAQEGRIESHDCTIATADSLESLDLRVKASPLEVVGQKFVVLAMRDISQEKKLRILERTFFHDILNTAGGVQGLAMLIDDAEDMDEVTELAPLLSQQAEQLVAALEGQRDMLAAERGELEVNHLPVGSLTVVQGAINLYRGHPVAEDKIIHKDPGSVRQIVKTGKVLLQRTLGNMLKNALEAARPGETVTIGCHLKDSWVRFQVHNNAVMPPEVQDMIFRRSFSTKGTGRGIGTYSMKLMGEKYLGGKVGFSSEPETGTTFWIDLPQQGSGDPVT